MPEVVKMKVFNAGIFKNRVECLLDFTNRLTVLSRALKDVSAFVSGFRLQHEQFISDRLIHWQKPRLVGFGLRQDQVVVKEINLAPLKRENLSASHSGIQRQNDYWTKVRPSADQYLH